MSKWFDLFKTGTHTDMSGRKHTYTSEDLKTIERKFNEADDDAALTVGHPKDNSPAYGWLKRVRTVGDKLQGLATDIVPEFAEAVRKRMYKKISVSLRPDMSIRHVGFLGGAPPAVKGLNAVPLVFSEEPDALEFEFSESDLNFSDSWFALSRIRTIGHMMQSMRDYILGKDGIEMADKVAPQSDIDWLKEDPPPDPVPVEVGIKSFNEPNITPEKGVKEDKMELPNKPVIPGADKPADFAEKVTALEGENVKLRTENETLKKGKVEGEVRNFVEKVKAAGRLLPKFERGITEILVDLKAAGQEINFSETEKKSAYDLLADFVESMPVQVPLKEVGAPQGGAEDAGGDFVEVDNVDEERLDLHNKAKALAAKENIPYDKAVNRLLKGGK
jgi:hypothetical protein